jgi:uncharacterized protein YlxW (UPF0749 family)
MKFNLHTQHRRNREGEPGISLFPFLAVMICTMGALVPLLFAITRQARLQASQAAVAKIAERKVEIQTEHETTQWRIDQLKTSRKKTNEQVADTRLELGHLEDHARRLREKIPALEKTVAELDQLGSDDNRQRSEQIEELEKLRAQIDAVKQQVTKAQLDAASQKKSYAVIPYEGPNQTNRRPIYLECRADALILQPEGIEFPESDFEGPLGPGNPLASTLRAVREYLLASHNFDPQRDGEPYPLLLVRPDGIAAYYAARAAMTSWATEFGYELIDADWKLAYQPPNAQLAQVVQQVLVSARARQQRLIAAAPAAYAKKTKATYRASPSRGGSVRVGGSADDDEDATDSGYLPLQPAGRIGRGYGPPGTGSSQPDSPGPTEAQRVASLYGSPGRGSSTPGGQGGVSGNGYGPALAGGGMGANAPQQGIPGGAYGTGSGTSGGKSGVVGGGNGSVGGGSGMPGGGNGSAGYADTSIGNGGNGGTGLASGTGNMDAGLAGQGTSNGALAASDGQGSSTQNSGYTGGNMDTGGYPGGNPGNGRSGGNSGSSTYNESVASGGSNSNGSGGGNGTGSNRGSGTGKASIGGISGTGSGQPGAEQGAYGGPTTLPEGNITGDRGQATGDRGSGRQVSSPEGYIAGQPPTEKNLSDQKQQAAANQPMADQATAQRVLPLRPGEWRESEKPPTLKPVEEKLDGKKNGKSSKSLAAKRGRDWALPDAAHGSVPVTRPIRVECRADQLIIVPESGLSGGKTIPISTSTEASTQAFISAVWEHMETWGIAGRGMYWRPILNVYVAPGAEQRFADLQMLLEGSGLKIERK